MILTDEYRLKAKLNPKYGICIYCGRYSDVLYAMLPSDPFPECPYAEYKNIGGHKLCVNWVSNG